MKITTEPLENRQVEVTIELGEERTEQALRRTARLISREVDIPGFRRGKAPYGAIVQRYGEKVVRQEAASALAEDIIEEALKEEGIHPYGPVELNDVMLNPITYRCTVPLQPVVDLGDYRDYRREMPEVEVPEEDVQEELDEIRRQNAVLEPLDRPAAIDDVVVLDLSIETDEGQMIYDEEYEVHLAAESEHPAPGFAEEVAGMEIGQERTFTLTLPDDFPEEEFQAQDATFSVQLKEVYNHILPEFDDDLARTVGPYDSLEELKEHIRQRLMEEAWEEAEAEYTEQVVEDIVEQARFDYPPHILEEELDEMVEQFEESLKQQQHLTLEDYLRLQDQTEEELRESLKPEAKKSLKISSVLGKVVQVENLEVDEDEVSEKVDAFARMFGERADVARAEIDTTEGRDHLRRRLLTDKAIARLVAIAKGEAPELDADTETPEAEIEEEPEAAESTDAEG